MLDFLIPILAKFWDTFKVKNPALASLVALILGTILYFATQNSLLGVIPVPEAVAKVIQIVTTVWLALNGSRTTSFLSSK